MDDERPLDPNEIPPGTIVLIGLHPQEPVGIVLGHERSETDSADPAGRYVDRVLMLWFHELPGGKHVAKNSLRYILKSKNYKFVR